MKKTAIVTGAVGNLGQAVVKNFIDSGIQVIGTILPHEQERYIFLKITLYLYNKNWMLPMNKRLVNL